MREMKVHSTVGKKGFDWVDSMVEKREFHLAAC
jgi:hypothetical protein